MSLELTARRRSMSQTSSGRSTPVPRASRRAVEDGLLKNDKGLRKYGVTIERALASWEISPQEWADYIAFLGRLLKALQTRPNDAPILPHSGEVASKLAQCMNPALPSGVHQKALEVYHYIFSAFGQGYLSGHLHEFLPGLAAVLSFASLTVRPGLYSIFEEFLIHLPASDLRPLLKSLILSLLPALEEETSEDFDRALAILECLEHAFSPIANTTEHDPERDGYFWQCLFLGVITSPSRRQGALNFFTRKLPRFANTVDPSQSRNPSASGEQNAKLSILAEAVLSPEPGLLVRCFAAGLSDSQLLVQRGFLDLLVTHIPLSSPVIQSRVRDDDVDRLMAAACRVLLRREMSLNRRLWSWFLGPSNTSDSNEATDSSGMTKEVVDDKSKSQLDHFMLFGKSHLERCILAMFDQASTSPAERARPFRICLSLMDRWEIGGAVIPQIFLPAMQNAYRYSRQASEGETTEVLRSASLFFDGIESMLIWAHMLRLLRAGTSSRASRESMLTFLWIVQRFNVKDEEMLTIHIPQAATYLLALLMVSDLSGDVESTSLDILIELIDIMPDRAFKTVDGIRGKLSTEDGMVRAKRLRTQIEDTYRSPEQSAANEGGLSPGDYSSTSFDLLASFAARTLSTESTDTFSQCVTAILTLAGKLSIPPTTSVERLFIAIREKLDLAVVQKQLLAFSTLNAIVLLLAGTRSSYDNKRRNGVKSFDGLETRLYGQLWAFLSLERPKFNVEAVRAIWQLHETSFSRDLTEASLTAHTRFTHHDSAMEIDAKAETIRRFAVLWNHSIPPVSHNRAVAPNLMRRVSTMPSTQDIGQSAERLKILTTPLMLVLDTLSDSTDSACEVTSLWLRSVPSLEQILRIHFDMLDTAIRVDHDTSDEDVDGSDRRANDTARDIEYILHHILGILRCSNSWIWQCLTDMSCVAKEDDTRTPAFLLLAETCSNLLANTAHASTALKRECLEILRLLLSSPSAMLLKPIDLDSRLLDHLMESLREGHHDLQGEALQVVTLAIRLRLADEESDEAASARSSINLKRQQHAGPQAAANGSASSSTSTPPPQLLSCLKLAFSSPKARLHIDQWVALLADILPEFVDAIFANLVPFVECICKELDKISSELLSLSQHDNPPASIAPETTASALLDALGMVLTRALQSLAVETNTETEQKVATQPRSLLGNMTAGVFKTEGPPSRTQQSNSRLTVILALQDTVRVSVKLWAWSSRHTDIENFDKISSATASYNASKVRSRTKHVLEELFNVEPLETLEVVIYTWCHSTIPGQAHAMIDLLDVIKGLRPKTIVPATLDALCSRINSVILPPARQSSQTTDLSAIDIIFFLRAYLHSMEDDAMDEVWADCLAFFRDVLSNPMPYRQILPALLSISLLLAQKVDNTNFGEQRKMRRDLGDLFLRLLSATMTSLPTSNLPESYATNGPHGEDLSNSDLGRSSMSLISVLKEVTTSIEVILETPDRTTTAINNITTSFIGPLLHAKSFPQNMSPDSLAVMLQIAKKAPIAKSWKKELSDAFNDPKLMLSSTERMEQDWFPVLYQWCVHDKERMPELISRLVAPSSAGIMFGVGASAARLEADRKAQLNIRRICILLLAAPTDTYVPQIRDIWHKLVELFDATLSSSPSAAVKAELFMLCRALVLCTSSVHLSPLWPVINDTLQSALSSLASGSPNSAVFGNLALLQACKLLDLLVALSPDEFQLHEWLYISDTIDAVYQPSNWTSSALSDQMADHLTSEDTDNTAGISTIPSASGGDSERKRPLIPQEVNADIGDYKALARDDFARTVLRPFLSQLSIHAYEGVYSMDVPDLNVWRRILLTDVLDLGTIVE